MTRRVDKQHQGSTRWWNSDDIVVMLLEVVTLMRADTLKDCTFVKHTMLLE